MTDTLVGVSRLRKTAKKTLTPDEVERNAVRELVKAARARGDDLTGPEGLLKVITKQVIEAALEEEMTEHVGYDKQEGAVGKYRPREPLLTEATHAFRGLHGTKVVICRPGGARLSHRIKLH